MGDALEHDRRGRPLPIWTGCRLVADGELFLMNWQVRDSLDGRYFGPLPANSVIGRATPLNTHADGNGRFVWPAATRSRRAHRSAEGRVGKECVRKCISRWSTYY